MNARTISYNFDDLDFQIIQALKFDARASASDIARIIGANERTVRKRIDRLVDLQAVRLTAIIDPRAFSYTIATNIFLEVDHNREVQVLDLLKSMPQVTYIAFGEGSNDLSIEARFKDSHDLALFLRHNISQIPGVTLKGHALVPAILKNIDEWMPSREDFGIQQNT